MRHALIPATASSVSAPLGAAAFAAAMEKFSPLRKSTRLAIAVSGGPDSMALAFCARRWMAKTKGATMIALIVDHGLRPQSAAEAATTKKSLSALGIPAEILSWQHPPIVTRLHDTARKARYRLLTEACRAHGIRHLLLAHQREDQAETILMRFAKGSGINGLAGMAAASMMEDIHIWRPFLSFPKSQLIATCKEAEISFVTDRSNASDKFARGRLRRVMTLLEAEGLTIDRLIDLGERAGGVKEALDHYALALLRVATAQDAAGTIRFRLEHLRSAPAAIAERALNVCLQSVHAEEYAPERASLATLLTALRGDDEMPSRTLHGCLISKNDKHAIIMREYANVLDAVAIRPGESVVWDRRWRITLAKNVGGKDWVVKPFGHPPHERIDRLAPGLRRLVPQGRSRATLPALWRGDKLMMIPALMPGQNKAWARLLTPWPVDNSCLASL